MWFFDVAPSPFLPPALTHFPPRFPVSLTLSTTSFIIQRRGVDLLVSKDSLSGWTWWGLPLALLLQTVWICGPPGGSGTLPGRLQSLWLPSGTVPWVEAACGP